MTDEGVRIVQFALQENLDAWTDVRGLDPEPMVSKSVGMEVAKIARRRKRDERNCKPND
jgi:hypothetical protein